MVAKTIDVTKNSEVARLVVQAEEEPLILVVNGARYRLMKERPAQQSGIHEPIGGYDAERFLRTLREVAGSISPDEGERMKAHIRAARDAGSRPVDTE